MGQIGAAITNPNTFAPEPSGFSGAEWATRIGGMGLKGLGQGLQSYNQENAALRNRAGGGMIQPSQDAGPVDPSYFLPQQSRGSNNPYFYGYGNG